MKGQNTWIAKIGEKSIGVPPIFHPVFFLQNYSEWLEMDFKHNLMQFNILTRKTPPGNICYIFFFKVSHCPITGRYKISAIPQMKRIKIYMKRRYLKSLRKFQSVNHDPNI